MSKAQEKIVDEIMAERDKVTDPQDRANLVLAALGYHFSDAHQIELMPADEDDVFEVSVSVTLDAAGQVIEERPEDDCLASNLEIDADADGEGQSWSLPEFFRVIGAVQFRASTSDLQRLWTARDAH